MSQSLREVSAESFTRTQVGRPDPSSASAPPHPLLRVRFSASAFLRPLSAPSSSALRALRVRSSCPLRSSPGWVLLAPCGRRDVDGEFPVLEAGVQQSLLEGGGAGAGGG